MLSKKSTVDLKTRNKDYAVFLPSISGFYQTFISKQQKEEFVPTNRIPKEFENGIEGMNFLNKEQAYFYYPDALYSAGHAQLNITKSDIEESMVQKRDKNNPDSFILGDSGGFQIGKGVINFDWQRFWEQKGEPGYVGTADKTRLAILNWLEHTADYSMVLDIPTWSAAPINQERTGLKTFADCLNGTLHNNDFFLKHRQGKTKFLNVLQGGTNEDADTWYEAVKKYCDKKQYGEQAFNGWAMGGNNMKDADLMLRRLVKLRDDNLLGPGFDVIHFLGTSKLELACLLTAIQRNIRQHVNPNMKVTFDCASPFLATAYGQVYTQHVHTNKRFSYIMDKAVDDRRLAGSDTPWPWSSPIGERLTMGDVCYYKPGQANKNGKVGNTSWDSFAYFLMMGHNVYQHIESVQRANALNDTACGLHQPDPSDWGQGKKGSIVELSNWVPRNVIYMTELVNRIFKSETPFSELDKAQIDAGHKVAVSVLDSASRLLADFNGKKTLKTNAYVLDQFFEKVDPTTKEKIIDKGNDNDSDLVESFDESEVEQKLKDLE